MCGFFGCSISEPEKTMENKQTNKKLFWVKTKHSLKSCVFLVLLGFFVFFLFFYWFTWLHLCPYACLPYLSWKVKLWSKFLTQELAHYVRLSLAWDVLWCLCTWKLAVAALSCSISSNFCANLGILDSYVQISCLVLTYSNKVFKYLETDTSWILWEEWWGISLRTCNIAL